LMYGFSDEPIPASDSVSVMEEILIEYLANVVRNTQFFFGYC